MVYLFGMSTIKISKSRWKQIPTDFCSMVGTRFREISFRFGDAKIVQKLLPTQFSIENPIPEVNENVEGGKIDIFGGKVT